MSPGMLTPIIGLFIIRPTRTWSYNNFSVLFAVALFPYCWWSTLFLIFFHHVAKYISLVSYIVYYAHVRSSLSLDAVHQSEYFARLVHDWYSGLRCEFHGITCSHLQPEMDYPRRSVPGLGCHCAAGNSVDYWLYIFPASVLGTTVDMLTYAHTK
jgi:hypothetical protein